MLSQRFGNDIGIVERLSSLRYALLVQIGQRLRSLRQAKNLDYRDIRELTGLFGSYTSRVECGHTVPTINNLEKYALALEIPLYKLFYEGGKPPTKIKLRTGERSTPLWGSNHNEKAKLRSLMKAVSRMGSRERNLLLGLARQVAKRNRIRDEQIRNAINANKL